MDLAIGGDNTYQDDYESIGGIFVDTIHNRLLVTGTFYQQLKLTDTTIYGWGLTGFVLSMDYNGNVIWARAGVSVEPEFGEVRLFDVTCDEQGNVYVSGCTRKACSFDGQVVTPGGFLVKYDKDGNILWAKNKFRYWTQWPPNPLYPYTEAPPFNLAYWNNHLYINGNTYNDTIVIDTITVILSPGYHASYIASFSTQGEIIWLKLAGGPSANCGSKLSLDLLGGIYITGVFGEQGIFGEDTILSQTSSGNCFFAKYRTDGSYAWATSVNSSRFAIGQAVKTDMQNHVYFSGTFSGSAQFGNTVILSDSDWDMFLTHFTGDGICNGVRHYSSGGMPGLTTDWTGNVCMAGWFDDSLTIGSNTFHSRGKSDIFAAKCSPITGMPQPLESPANTLLIYANPNTGLCTVTIPEEFRNEKNLKLQIFDQTGRLVLEARMEMTGESVKLDIRAQAKGIYIAVLSNGKKSYKGKIVFE